MVPYSILIVDDDEKLCALLRSYFEQEQCLVYIANDGAADYGAGFDAARHGRL